jgi:REP-associated tyrosine transposase
MTEYFFLFLNIGLRGRNNLTDEHFFFVTTTVVKFIPVFKNSSFCDILIENIKHYQLKYKYEILAFVIMPSHFHWIVKVNPAFGTISDIMRDIKKFSAWQILDKINESGNKVLEKIFIQEAKEIADQDRKLWMKRFDDEVIRNEKMFWSKLFYIHNNPMEAGLVRKPEDYKYSSARNYINNDHSVIYVNTVIGGVYLP